MNKINIPVRSVQPKKQSGAVIIPRYCERCHDHTQHISKEQGIRETITCIPCGHQNTYVVR